MWTFTLQDFPSLHAIQWRKRFEYCFHDLGYGNWSPTSVIHDCTCATVLTGNQYIPKTLWGPHFWGLHHFGPPPPLLFHCGLIWPITYTCISYFREVVIIWTLYCFTIERTISVHYSMVTYFRLFGFGLLVTSGGVGEWMFTPPRHLTQPPVHPGVCVFHSFLIVFLQE
jgi:hypothetical protein